MKTARRMLVKVIFKIFNLQILINKLFSFFPQIGDSGGMIFSQTIQLQT